MKKLIKKFKKLFLIVLCVLVALCIFQWYEQSQDRCSITKIVLCVLVALCIFQWYEQSQDRCSITKTTFTENSLPKQFKWVYNWISFRFEFI